MALGMDLTRAVRGQRNNKDTDPRKAGIGWNALSAKGVTFPQKLSIFIMYR